MIWSFCTDHPPTQVSRKRAFRKNHLLVVLGSVLILVSPLVFAAVNNDAGATPDIGSGLTPGVDSDRLSLLQSCNRT